MPAPRLRSRSLRELHVKVPGGRSSTHYKKKKPMLAKCGRCGDVLKGIPREFPFRMHKMPKTQKRPERPFGGVLCTRCMRVEMVNRHRK